LEKPGDLPRRHVNPPTASRMALWVAQGFGVGRVPVAPGTFGSVVGLAWFAVLVAGGRLWVLVAGCVAGAVLSVWLCGIAEGLLGKKDPGSVVLDEIIAMPCCFLGWVGMVTWKTGTAPSLSYFFSGRHWLLIIGVFAAFRFFDVLKPWPANKSQSLPGGWGITVDDLLAAGYVNVAVVLVALIA
jgi:phosphatidylglycerophosphatase A